MTSRAAHFLFAAVTNCLACIALPGSVEIAAAAAATECLSSPKGEVAKGAHWYYRIDRATKRRCWYVRNGSRPPQTRSVAAQTAEPVIGPRLQETVANARAEIPADAVIAEPVVSSQQLTNPDPPENITLSGAANPRGWLLASRWSNAYGDAGEGPLIASIDDVGQRLKAAAAHDHPPPQAPGLFLVAMLAGTLAFAGAVAAGLVIFRFRPAKPEPLEPSKLRAPDSAFATQRPTPNGTSGEPVLNWIRIARETEAAKRSGRDIEEVLRGLRRRPLA